MNTVIVEHDVTVHLGHVLDVLPTLPAESVHCVVTSPPYYGLRDYGVEGQLGLESSPAEYVERMRAVFAEVRRVLRPDGVLWLNLGDSYSGSGPSGASYQSATTQCRAEGDGTDGVFRVSKTLGERGLDYGRKKPIPADGYKPKDLMGIPWRTAFALQGDGWTLRNAIIWSKPNAMPESVTDRLSTRYEHVFLFSRSRRYWFDLDAVREPGVKYPAGLRDAASPARGVSDYDAASGFDGGGHKGGYRGTNESGRNPGDVWTIPTAPFPGAHFACMPPELARRCILAGCPDDGTVLDPFAGSGTTLKVARSLGRQSVGVELNPAYIDIIRERIGQTPLDFGEATA